MPRRGHPVLVCLSVFVVTYSLAAIQADTPPTKKTSWQPLVSGVGNNLLDVTFVSNRKGFAVGESQTLLNTEDSGKTWRRVIPEKHGDDFSQVLFTSPQDGWVVSRRVRVILHTSDGGATWTVVALPKTDISLKHVCCAAAVGSRFFYLYWGLSGTHLYETRDAGASWTELTDKITVGGVSDAASLVFVDAQRGWCSRFSGTPGKAFIGITTDGGRTWEERPLAVGWKTRLSFADARHGWALPEFGQIQATTDGGLSWTAQTIGQSRTKPLLDLQFTNSQTGYVLHWSDGGKNLSGFEVRRTNDGGHHWDLVGDFTQTIEQIRAVAFTEEGMGCVVGTKGAMFHYVKTE